MGTYTTNYNLFMPSIGEQGWGDLVNGNFTTIDTAMKGLDARIGTLETDTDAVEERVTVIENGDISGSRIEMPTLSYEGYYSISVNEINGLYGAYVIIFSSPFPISGVISIKCNKNGYGRVFVESSDGLHKYNIPTTQTEFTINNAFNIWAIEIVSDGILTIGIPKLVYD